MDTILKQVVSVGVRFRFVALHRWKDAPDQVAFLRQFHRHLFNVQVVLPVTELDRELEFFIVQRDLQAFVDEHFVGQAHDASCETFAAAIGSFVLNRWPRLPSVSTTVDEDGENFASVTLVRRLDT